MFKNLRIKIWNWLAAGKVRIVEHEDKKIVNSGYTLTAGAGSSYSLGGGAGAGVTLNTHNSSNINLQSGINFTVAQAGGGWIVQVNRHDPINYHPTQELHIIAEGADFDRELGKIITMSCLKG